MVLAGNLLWFIFGGGLIMAVIWCLMGCLFAVTIIGIPFAIAAFRIAGYVAFPFGRELVDAQIIGEKRIAGTGFANFLWVILAGFWLALSHALCGLYCFLGFWLVFPVFAGIAHMKIAGVAFAPLGKRIVSKDLAKEAVRRKVSGDMDRRLGIAAPPPPREVAVGPYLEGSTPAPPALPRQEITLEKRPAPLLPVIPVGTVPVTPPENSRDTVPRHLACPICKARYDAGKKYCPLDGAKLAPENTLAPEVIAKRQLLDARLTESPNDLSLLLEYGAFLASIELYDEAQVRFYTVLQLDPGNTDARRALAATFRRSGEYDRAARELLDLARESPDNAALWEEAGTACLDARQISEGVNALLAACRKAGADLNLLYRVLKTLDTHPQASSYAREAVEMCQIALRQEPRSKTALDMLGRNLLMLGHVERAGKAFADLYDAYPNNARANLRTAAGACDAATSEDGVDWNEIRRRLDLARHDYDELTAMERTEAQLYWCCASLRGGLTEGVEEALSQIHYSELQEAGADLYSVCWRLLADKFRKNQDYARAKNCHRVALRYGQSELLNREAAELDVLMADELAARGKLTAARDLYKEALDLFPLNTEARDGFTRMGKKIAFRYAFLGGAACMMLVVLTIAVIGYLYGWEEYEILVNYPPDRVVLDEFLYPERPLASETDSNTGNVLYKTGPLYLGTHNLTVVKDGYVLTKGPETLKPRWGRKKNIVEMELAPRFASIRLDTLPSGAEVVIENKGNALSAITPCSLRHVLAVQDPVVIKIRPRGCDWLEISKKVNPGDEADMGTVNLTGSMKVDSTPSGAEVLVDGQSKGATPLQLDGLPPKRHLVALRHPEAGFGFGEAVINPEETSDLGTIVLRPGAGALFVDSNPAGKEIRVDSNVLGKTPLLISGIEPGLRKVELRDAPGTEAEPLMPVRREVEIKTGELTDTGIISLPPGNVAEVQAVERKKLFASIRVWPALTTGIQRFSGGILAQIHPGADAYETLKEGNAFAGDFDGDGVTEYVFSARSKLSGDKRFCFVIAKELNGEITAIQQGRMALLPELAYAGDIDGDKAAEVLIFQSGGGSSNRGTSAVLEFIDGKAQLFEVEYNALPFASVLDMDSDGKYEIMIPTRCYRNITNARSEYWHDIYHWDGSEMKEVTGEYRDFLARTFLPYWKTVADHGDSDAARNGKDLVKYYKEKFGAATP